MHVTVNISPGELIDRITILEIKRARVTDAGQQESIAHQLGELERVLRDDVAPVAPVQELTERLREINGALWELEDEIRVLDRCGDRAERFVEVAREILRENDLRAAVKSRINEALGSRIVEEKAYAD